MRGWLLDTNVVASLIAQDGSPSVKAWAGSQDERRLFISVLCLAEHDKGIAQLDPSDVRRHKFAAHVRALEARFASRVLPLNDSIVRRWGVIAGQVRRSAGHPPPVIDTMMAATALEAGLYLATRNVRDVIHSGALVFNPWLDDPADFPLA